MTSSAGGTSANQDFVAFVAEVEPRVRQALVATYGPVDGREAAVDALSWAWEHWDRARSLEHPVPYLYRVGQSAIRRFGTRPLPSPDRWVEDATDAVTPELLPALARLSAQQRTIVLLVHGMGWRQSEVAELMSLNPSTVREHLSRALVRLRQYLEVSHDA